MSSLALRLRRSARDAQELREHAARLAENLRDLVAFFLEDSLGPREPATAVARIAST